VDDLGTLLAGAGTPTPPTGGGVTSSCGATYDFGSIPRATSTANSVPAKITLTNKTQHDIGRRGMQITQAASDNIFGMLDQVGQVKTLKPGESVTVTIEAVVFHEAPGVHSGKLTQLTDQPDPQPCIALTVTVT